MSATVHRLAAPGQPEELLTKQQLAAKLDRSERWIELKQREPEGLPIAETDRFGRRRYRLTDVRAWLNSPRVERTTAQRLADLEREVRELRAMIEGSR